MTRNCPDEGSLARFLHDRLPAAERLPIERHLSACVPCGMAVASSLQAAAEQGRPIRKLRRRPVAVFAAAAAGIGIVIAAGLWFRNTGSRPGAPGRPGAEVSSPAGQRFGDGTRVERLDASTRLEELPAASGERLRLKLERGHVRIDVPKGTGAWRLLTPAGEARVLGTAFRIHAGRIPLETGPVPVTIVEVEEGRVLIANRSGQGEIRAGHRGILWGDEPPVTQIRIAELPDAVLFETFAVLARNPSPRLAEAPWVTFLGFHARAAGLLRKQLPEFQDSVERKLAAQLAAGLGSGEAQ